MIVLYAKDQRRAYAKNTAALDRPLQASWIPNAGRTNDPSKTPWRCNSPTTAAKKKAEYVPAVDSPHEDAMIHGMYLSVLCLAKDWKSGLDMRNGA